jgi:hypothetical protein
MAKGVVDLLEAIQVDEDQRNALVPSAASPRAIIDEQRASEFPSAEAYVA